MLTTDWVEYPTELMSNEGFIRENATSLEAAHLLLNFSKLIQNNSASNRQQLSEAKHHFTVHPQLLTEQQNDVLSIHNYALSNRTQFIMEAEQQAPLQINHFRSSQSGIVASNGLQGASSVTDSQITQAIENEFIFNYDGPELFDETSQVPLQIRPFDEAIIFNGSISSVIQNSTSLEADSQAKLLSEQTIDTQNETSKLPSSAVQTEFNLPTMPFNFVRPQNKVAQKMPKKSILKQTSSFKGGKMVPPALTTKNKAVIISNEVISLPSLSVVEPLKPRANIQVNTARTKQIQAIRKANESTKKSSSSVSKPLGPKQINSQPLNKTIVPSNESAVPSNIPILKLPLKRKLEEDIDSTTVKETILTLPPIGATITHTYVDGHTESVLLPEISIQRVARDAEKKRFKTSFDDVISQNERLMQILKTNNVTVFCSSNKQRRLM